MKIFRLLLTINLIMSFVITSLASSRSLEESALIAKSFFGKNVSSAQKAPSSATIIQSASPFKIQLSNSEIENSDKYFHIFNAPNNGGFVIISTNQQTKTILGYSDEGNFDNQNIPENLKQWLAVYAGEIESINLQPEKSVTQPTKIVQNSTENSNLAASVSPLLRNIKWNQNSPYNLLCPIIDSTNNTRAAAGCGATALAQVMKYYNWPPSGSGSNSYTTETLKIPLNVNFAGTQYDWANMTGIYNTASTEVQKNAVATLIYHCAVAVNMDFNKSSSAYTTDIARALFKNFGYDSNAQVYIRNYYTRNEWENMIKTELNNNRPVLYNGQASDGGHIFVCDGYDANGLYHINWGWGGISDGYFELSALNPNELGIGGGNAGGYNSDQYMIIGIQKPTSASLPTYHIYTNSALSSTASQIGRNESFGITTQKTFNYGINTIAGSFGVGLYNGNSLVQVLSYGNINLNSFYGWNTYTFNSLTIPTATIAGNYRIYIIYKPSTSTEWSIVRGKTGTPNYMNVTVEASLVKFSVPTEVYPTLSLQKIETIGNLYKNKTGRFKALITNNGGEYNSKLSIYLSTESNPESQVILTTDPVNIASGETKEVELNGTINVEPGNYKLGILYDANNYLTNPANYVKLGDLVNVQVLNEPETAPVLTLNTPISFANPQNIFSSNATLSANITNSGGYFEDKLIAFIFPTTSPSSSLTYIGYQTGILDQNETKTIDFTGSIALLPGDYRIAVYYWNAASTATSKWTRITPTESSLIYFNLKEELTDTGIINVYPDTIFPNPATDFIYLKAEKKVDYVCVYDVYGKLIHKFTPSNIGYISLNISDFKSGAYLMYVKNSDNTTVHKFLKK